MRRATVAPLGVEPLVGALGQPRDRAAHAAGLLVGGSARRRRPSRSLPQLEQRGRQQRQRAGLALDVGDQRVDELRLDAQAGALRAGSSIARRSSSRRIGPTSTWLAPSRRAQLGVGGAAAVEVGAHRDQDERAAARVAHRGDERVGERRALGLVAAGGEDLLELVDGDDQPALGRGLRGRLLERRAAGAPPGAGARAPSRSLPGSTPAASAAQQAGRSAEDLPLPDGPTMPISGAPASRATISATSRSRPKKTSASSTSKRGEALERAGHDLVRGALGALADGLQLDDVAGEVVLGRPQPRALAGGARRVALEPPCRLGARPLARGAVHALRHAAALGEQARGRLGVRRAYRRATAHAVARRVAPSVHRRARRVLVLWPARAPAALPLRRRAEQRPATSAGAWSRSSSTSSVGRRAARACSSTARAASGAPAPEA